MANTFKSNPIYSVEFELIEGVKALRIKENWSQRELSKKMGFAESFVGKVESYSQDEKYNLRHMVILKEIFSLKSFDQLFLSVPTNDEMIIVEYEQVPMIKKDGTEGKKLIDKLVRITPYKLEI